ncbi:hypothetical protein Dsin_017030 [Dipteronia sinensis]|uniref:Uncharacterized protein n=1 Tax=Dipteronia sinensis TaxID=43782 RepID=A0AAE0AEJ2_9ROSI|nr:hypothetical protein Dsin_017030 [Dipteronia sinensis]
MKDCFFLLFLSDLDSNCSLQISLVLNSHILFSPPTPKTIKSPLNFPFFTRTRKSQISKSIFDKKSNSSSSSQTSKTASSHAAFAAPFLSSLTPQALDVDNVTPPQPLPVIEAQPTMLNPSNSSPVAQNLILTAPKPQSQSSDLPDGSQWRYNELLNNNNNFMGMVKGVNWKATK